MELFNLPLTTKVNKVIPKNAFEGYTTSKQKKLFTDLIARITWTHKLATDTVNLEAKDIKEIQVFKIELKKKEDIQVLLDLIDKSIPYNIIFVIEFNKKIYVSTSAKHPHPVSEDNSIVDWTFKSEWFRPSENKYTFQLKKSIDAVYHDFCSQLSGHSSMASKPFKELISHSRKLDTLEKEILKIKSSIKKTKQFNYKVELNLMLKEKEQELHTLIRA